MSGKLGQKTGGVCLNCLTSGARTVAFGVFVCIIDAMTQSRWYALTAFVVVAGIAALVWGRVPPEAGTGPLPPAPAIGHPAPDFTLSTLDGQMVTLSDLRGKPVILNFWATWCGPCRAEMPELQRVHERLESAGLTVLGVNQAESMEAIARYQQDLGVDFPTAMDSRLGVSRQYLVNSLPTTFFIDREGVIRNLFIGPMTDAVLAQNLRSIYP